MAFKSKKFASKNKKLKLYDLEVNYRKLHTMRKCMDVLINGRCLCLKENYSGSDLM